MVWILIILLMSLCLYHLFYYKQFIYYSKDECGYCTAFTPIWEEVKVKYPNVKMVQCKKLPKDLRSVPMVRFYKGTSYKEYLGSRDIESLSKFIESNM